MKDHDAHADCHFAASGIAAIANFPLWRASAIAQSGFKVPGSNFVLRYYNALLPNVVPYRGVLATMLGMTWARGAIFYGSDTWKKSLLDNGVHMGIAQTAPPLVIGTLVQIANMPLVRATITIQNPSSDLKNVTEALVYIYKTRGVAGLWHGVSAGILKTVPKYVTAVAVKDLLEEHLPPVADAKRDKGASMLRSGIKSTAAGLAGAILTNPLDVLRNEMFKTDLSLYKTLSNVLKQEGWSFMFRGVCVCVFVCVCSWICCTQKLK